MPFIIPMNNAAMTTPDSMKNPIVTVQTFHNAKLPPRPKGRDVFCFRATGDGICIFVDGEKEVVAAAGVVVVTVVVFA